MNTQAVKDFLLQLQELIIERMETLDGKAFRRDSWERPEGGGGISAVIEEGNLLERGGVNRRRRPTVQALMKNACWPRTGMRQSS